MDLSDILNRSVPPEPWAEGDNIPWSEPGFSARMLREHLTQEHDLASRRTYLIDAQVAWICSALLDGPHASVLDLACGPGLYARRFAELGHRVRGIDYSPASIEYAQSGAAGRDLDLEFSLADLREAEFGRDHDLVLLIYDEFHVFRRREATAILDRIAQSLRRGGRLLLELSSPERLQRTEGEERWQTHDGGLFSDAPYLELSERFWDEPRQAATHRYFIVDIPSGTVRRYAVSYQAYSRERLTELLRRAGFRAPSFHEQLGVPTPGQEHWVLVAERA